VPLMLLVVDGLLLVLVSLRVNLPDRSVAGAH
jgi:hypothetical protein